MKNMWKAKMMEMLLLEFSMTEKNMLAHEDQEGVSHEGKDFWNIMFINEDIEVSVTT